MAMHGAAADLVAEAQAGRVLPPQNAQALAETVRELAALPGEERDAMGRRGKDYLAKNLSRESVVPRYRAMLHRLAKAIDPTIQAEAKPARGGP
jgi:glycosyltransferase involved in cell wall biosynthesis